jgi:hypothetical protein
MATLQHLAKNTVGIVAAFIGASGVVVIDPGIDDHLGTGVVAKKESVLPEERIRPANPS